MLKPAFIIKVSPYSVYKFFLDILFHYIIIMETSSTYVEHAIDLKFSGTPMSTNRNNNGNAKLIDKSPRTIF